MKRIVLSLAALLAASAMYAQNATYYKAEEQALKDGNPEKALETLQKDFTAEKVKNQAFAYYLAGEIQAREINKMLDMLKNKQPIDTTKFCTTLDNAIEYFTKSHALDLQPNEKGKIKSASNESADTGYGKRLCDLNKKRVKDMLQYYGYAANFENQRHNQKGAYKYFVKDLELPNNTIFTKAEKDSIIKKNKSYYDKIGYYTAMLAFEQKDYDNVLKYVDYAIGDETSRRDGYVMKLNTLLAKGDTAKWVATCKQAIEDMPNNLTNCQNLLKYYDDHKMVNEAKDMADELVQKSPNNKIAWYARGCVMMNTMKNYPEARIAFAKALAIDSTFAYAQFNQGCTYVNQLMSIRDQLTTDRSKVDKYNADMAKARGYYRKAKPFFENALVLTPDKPSLWGYSLQTVYYNLQDGAVKEKMKQEEADMKKVLDGTMQGADFISKYNIQQTAPAL